MEDEEPAILAGFHKAKGHHRTIEDLYEAAVAECYICSQLFRNWERWYWISFEGGPERTPSAPERDRIMIVEVTKKQQKALREKYGVSRPYTMVNEDYVSRYSVSTLNGYQDSGAREIAFTTASNFFNRSDSTARYIPHTWHIWFVALPSERKYNS